MIESVIVYNIFRFSHAQINICDISDEDDVKICLQLLVIYTLPHIMVLCLKLA